MNNKLPSKGALSGTHDLFFAARNHTSGTAEARVAEFCMQVGYINC